MSQPTPLSEREHADLVAYLDGELSGAEARTLETKLSLHAAARAEADALRRTWELLDYLPKTQPSPSFTHRTLQRLTPVRAREQRWRKILYAGAWLASLLLAGWLGYAGYSRFAVPNPDASESIEEPRNIEKKREREWIERLPQRVQQELAKLPPAERERQIQTLREQERQQEILWKRPVGVGPRGK